MPRRSAAVATKDGATELPGMPPRPEGIPDDVWELRGALGNLYLARRIIDVSNGASYPRSDQEAMHLAETSEGLQRKALKRYLKLRQTIGQRLADAHQEYQAHKARTDILVGIMVDGSHSSPAPEESANGYAPDTGSESE